MKRLELKITHLGTWGLALIFIFCALCNTFIFGFTHKPSWDDASQYSAYASNLASGNGYSLDGKSVSIFREPGYPLFVSILYKVFGHENLRAVFVIQAVLLGLIGLLIYFLFLKIEHPTTGFIAGITVSFFPIYGYYAAELLTELLFTFLLLSIFYTIYVIVQEKNEDERYLLYCALGLLCGYTTLVRVQFLFFLPLLALTLLLCREYTWVIKRMLPALLVFVLIIGSWISYSYIHTKSPSLTEGRQGVILYTRVARAELSYTDQVRYLVSWLERSIPGSDWRNNYYLNNYDWSGTSQAYEKLATSPEQIEILKKENIDTIIQNPGRYLFGNFIELVKLLYLEHLKSPILSGIFRAFLYTVVYLWFLFGIIRLIQSKKHTELGILQISLLLFISYNIITLTFLDTIPRYNTPYLVFFILIGFVGLVMTPRNKQST